MSRRFATSVRYLQTGRVWREVRVSCGCHTPDREMAMSMGIVGVVEGKSFEDIESGEYREVLLFLITWYTSVVT